MCDTTNGYFLDPEALECSSCESNGDGLDRIGSSPSLVVCLTVAALVLIGFVSLCAANRGRMAHSLQEKAHAAKKLLQSALTHVFKHLGDEFSKEFADDPQGVLGLMPMRVNSDGSVTFVKKSKEYVPGNKISMTSTTRTSIAKISVTTIKTVEACDNEIETQVKIIDVVDDWPEVLHLVHLTNTASPPESDHRFPLDLHHECVSQATKGAD